MIPKFRAWFGAEMYAEPIVFDGQFYLDYRDFEDYRTYDGAVLMQSTGMFDKNGVEIFEGDIIEWWYSEGEFISQKGKFEVIWENGAFCPGENSDETLYIFLEGCEDDWYSVIGNIYANPELVEVSK